MGVPRQQMEGNKAHQEQILFAVPAGGGDHGGRSGGDHDHDDYTWLPRTIRWRPSYLGSWWPFGSRSSGRGCR